jgi:hypothetical protein
MITQAQADFQYFSELINNDYVQYFTRTEINIMGATFDFLNFSQSKRSSLSRFFCWLIENSIKDKKKHFYIVQI